MNPSAVHRHVGICTQHDVIWDELTVEEHLRFQACQKGIARSHISVESQRVAIAIGLDGDAYKTPAAKLSGGMRRRLSIGMSIIADPEILYMDEPTTGLDPDNRQQVWKIIQNLRSPKRMILITTHSMEVSK